MTTYEQQPFAGVEFAENPEARCPCILILDVSGSMSGTKINELNDGLRVFASELQADSMAAKRVEVAIVTFGPAEISQYFVTADGFEPPTLRASGDTPMGAAVLEAIRLANERKETYKAAAVGYYRPWLFLITDGSPTDDISAAGAAIREGEASKSFTFHAVGVDQADMNRLAHLGTRAPLKLRDVSFRELFVWLSNSLGSISRSQEGESVPLLNPAAPDGWAVID